MGSKLLRLLQVGSWTPQEFGRSLTLHSSTPHTQARTDLSIFRQHISLVLILPPFSQTCRYSLISQTGYSGCTVICKSAICRVFICRSLILSFPQSNSSSTVREWVIRSCVCPIAGDGCTRRQGRLREAPLGACQLTFNPSCDCSGRIY